MSFAHSRSHSLFVMTVDETMTYFSGLLIGGCPAAFSTFPPLSPSTVHAPVAIPWHPLPPTPPPSYTANLSANYCQLISFHMRGTILERKLGGGGYPSKRITRRSHSFPIAIYYQTMYVCISVCFLVWGWGWKMKKDTSLYLWYSFLFMGFCTSC